MQDLTDLPLGPYDAEGNPLIFDCFTKNDVKGKKCLGFPAKNISSNLVEIAECNGAQYLCVCIPCYNENFSDFSKTLISLMENFEFMHKKIRFHEDPVGQALRSNVEKIVAVIVPIFDGMKKMHEEMTDFLNLNFPGLMDEMLLELSDDMEQQIEVKIGCSKWWYYCHKEKETVSLSNINESSISFQRLGNSLHRASYKNPNSFSFTTSPNITSPAQKQQDIYNDDIIDFYMVPIIKRNNHRKHNSHQWFFDGICEALGCYVAYAFLTDCGTTYMPDCLSRLLVGLILEPDLIGVTARQRVETPRPGYYPCLGTAISCFKGKHALNSKPCWKCYAAYLCSPCPLQGFEFEGAATVSLAMFNLIEVLPVMPGPCQLLDWQKMKSLRLVKEYFDLLMQSENTKAVPDDFANQMTHDQLSTLPMNENITPQQGQNGSTKSPSDISLSDFLRANMRLAEDRVLSFVCVFSTEYHTKWIRGATFYYSPEVTWKMLLAQRRRWLNGTFAAVLFFFISKQATEREYKSIKNKRLVNFFYCVILLQLMLTQFSAAVFGSTSYISLKYCGTTISYFSWVNVSSFTVATYQICPRHLWVLAFMMLYTFWVVLAFRAPGNVKPSESLVVIYAIIGVIYMIPVYFAMLNDASILINSIVIANMIVPAILALFENISSTIQYFLYLPWFLSLIIMFIVFIPSYSMARLWDTTWGNRETGSDDAVSKNQEQTLQRYSLIINVVLVLSNWILMLVFINLYPVGSAKYHLIYMFVLFFPALVQTTLAFLYYCLEFKKDIVAMAKHLN
eukprot:gene5571-7695_t